MLCSVRLVVVLLLNYSFSVCFVAEDSSFFGPDERTVVIGRWVLSLFLKLLIFSVHKKHRSFLHVRREGRNVCFWY